MKKFLSAMFIFAAFMLVIGQNNSAAAGDVYLGSYLDGDEVYLMTETVKKIPAGGGYYKCTVKVGTDEFFAQIDYDFFCEPDGWYYKNSEDFKGWVYDGRAPIAAKICDYLRQNYPF